MKNSSDGVVDFIKDFDKAYTKLKSRSPKSRFKDSEWSDYGKFLEDMEEYRDRLKSTTKELVTEEVIYNEPKTEEISETVINKLTDRILDSLKTKYQKEDISVDAAGSIGRDDTGMAVKLAAPLGGAEHSLVEPNDPRSNVVSQESYDHLKSSIDVLRTLGHHGKVGELSNLIGTLEVI